MVCRGVDGVLVWVNPTGVGEDRMMFDALLRDVSSEGVWVSAQSLVRAWLRLFRFGPNEVGM